MLSKRALLMVALPLMYAVTADAVMARAFSFGFIEPPEAAFIIAPDDLGAGFEDNDHQIAADSPGSMNADIFAMTVIPPDFEADVEQRPVETIGFGSLFRAPAPVTQVGSTPFTIPRSNTSFGPSRYSRPGYTYRPPTRAFGIAAVPAPAALPLILTALGALGFAKAGSRRRRR